MALITKGSKVYCFSKAGCIVYEDEHYGAYFPDWHEPMQQWYGDSGTTNGDKKFLQGSLIGTATGEKRVKGDVLYYQVNTFSENRSSTGFLGWGAGEYSPRPMLAWVSSQDATDSEDAAFAAFDKREDGASIEDIKKANANGDTGYTKPPKSAAGSGNTPGTGTPNANSNSSKILIYGLVVAVVGFVVYLFTRKKN